MHWFTAPDGTRFLIQTPLECAESLAKAFPDPTVGVTPQRFLEQIKGECPPPPEAKEAPGEKAEKGGGF